MSTSSPKTSQLGLRLYVDAGDISDKAVAVGLAQARANVVKAVIRFGSIVAVIVFLLSAIRFPDSVERELGAQIFTPRMLPTIIYVGSLVGVFAAIAFVPSLRLATAGFLDRRFRQSVVNRLLIQERVAARSAHDAVSPAVSGSGRGVVISFHADAFFVTDARTGEFVSEFHSRDVRDSNITGQDTQHSSERERVAQDGSTAASTILLVVYFRDPRKSAIELDFGSDGSKAREWKGRILAAADSAQAIEGVRGTAVAVAVKETVKEIVKVRCTYCAALVDQGVQRCSACGGKM